MIGDVVKPGFTTSPIKIHPVPFTGHPLFLRISVVASSVFTGGCPGSRISEIRRCAAAAPHILLCHVYGRQRRLEYSGKRQVIKPDDSNVFRDAVSCLFYCFHCPDGDQIVVCKIAARQLLAVSDQFFHIRICTFDGGCQQMEDAFARRHAAGADCFIEAGGPLGKVADLVGGLEIPGLRFICPYQVRSGEIGALHIVDQDTVAGDRLEVCIQQDKRERQLQKRKNVLRLHFCSKQDDAGTVGNQQVADLPAYGSFIFKDICDIQLIILLLAFL